MHRKNPTELEGLGHGDLFPELKKLVAQKYPELFASYQKHIEVNQKLAEKYGFSGQQVSFFTDEIRAATDRLKGFPQNIGGKGDTPPEGEPKKGRLGEPPKQVGKSASGGFVKRTGLVTVHAGEAIVPLTSLPDLARPHSAGSISRVRHP